MRRNVILIVFALIGMWFSLYMMFHYVELENQNLEQRKNVTDEYDTHLLESKFQDYMKSWYSWKGSNVAFMTMSGFIMIFEIICAIIDVKHIPKSK